MRIITFAFLPCSVSFLVSLLTPLSSSLIQLCSFVVTAMDFFAAKVAEKETKK